MPFVAYGGARPLARLGHFVLVCSMKLLVSELMSTLPTGCPHDHGSTNVFQEKTSFLLSLSFHSQMLAATNCGLVRGNCIVIALISMK